MMAAHCNPHLNHAELCDRSATQRRWRSLWSSSMEIYCILHERRRRSEEDEEGEEGVLWSAWGHFVLVVGFVALLQGDHRSQEPPLVTPAAGCSEAPRPRSIPSSGTRGYTLGMSKTPRPC